MTGSDRKDEEMVTARADALQRLLDAPSPRKLVVAGPGTGKTHAFKEVLRRSGSPALALTFLTSLVQDLDQSLGDLADVYSFHGFARRLLHTKDVPDVTRDVDYFPALDLIYADDVALFQGNTTPMQIAGALMNLLEDQPILERVLAIGSYYNAVGHTDSVYRVLRYLQANPDSVPTFAQIVVDEYQDFSLLETELIEALAAASPILIAGDDDQALYGFRHASASFIRELATDDRYAAFELPYCSRCTAVMVEATHLVVARAQAAGLLQARLDKDYVCFLPDKRIESEERPLIRHVRCSVETNKAPYIGRFISADIRAIPAEDIAESRDGGYPTVLIIGPKQFSQRVHSLLAEEFPDIRYKMSEKPETRKIDGYARLLRDRRSRLGWRILLGLDKPSGWQGVVQAALSDGYDIVDLLEDGYRDRQLTIVDLLSLLATQEGLTPDNLALLIRETDLEVDQLLREIGLEQQAVSPDSPKDQSDAELDHEPQILVTSLLGAKGLQASHVYIIGVNEGHFPLQNSDPTEDEVCQLLVALTRGRKSCNLVSTGMFGATWLGASVFKDWLEPLLDDLTVDKTFFSSRP